MKLSDIKNGMKVSLVQPWTDGTYTIIEGEVCTINEKTIMRRHSMANVMQRVVVPDPAIRPDGYVRIVKKTSGVDGYFHHYGTLYVSAEEKIKHGRTARQ